MKFPVEFSFGIRTFFIWLALTPVLAFLAVTIYVGFTFKDSRMEGYGQAIQANLRAIHDAKASWSRHHPEITNRAPTETELEPFFHGTRPPISIVGETYEMDLPGRIPTAVMPVRTYVWKFATNGRVTLNPPP